MRAEVFAPRNGKYSEASRASLGPQGRKTGRLMGHRPATVSVAADLLIFEARTMLTSYDWEGALEACRRVLDGDPDHVGALETMAQALWYGGQFVDVVRVTTRLLHLNPYEPGYRYTRGMASLSLGDLSSAAGDFRQAASQSNNPGFRAQVRSALEAVETWQDGIGVSSTGRPDSSKPHGLPVPGFPNHTTFRAARPN
jgi:hypothetical protein